MTLCESNSPECLRSFEKGLADRGGHREETLSVPEIEDPFCTLFPMTLCEKGDTFLEKRFWLLFWGLFVANALPPTRFRKPLNVMSLLLSLLL